MGSEGKVGRLRKQYLQSVAERDAALIVQIGAHDGSTEDPLHPFFQTNFHVRGLLVEPQCGPFEALEKMYANYPNVTCIRTAVAEGRSTLELWTVDLGDDRYGTMIGRSNPERIPYAMWRRPIKRFRGYKLKKEIVPAAPLSEILERASVEPKEISAFFTDTEGHDIEIVNQLLDLQSRPEVIQYEHVIADARAVFTANSRLTDLGYELSWSFRDVFAIRT
jgi:hypothetical protein